MGGLGQVSDTDGFGGSSTMPATCSGGLGQSRYQVRATSAAGSGSVGKSARSLSVQVAVRCKRQVRV